jgi:hypothetical protein
MVMKTNKIKIILNSYPMQKFLLLCVFSTLVFTANAQHNPVKNLKFYSWYVSPFNCFELSWSAPDSSQTDTLIGYNIYRNNKLYAFTKDKGISSNRCIGDTSKKYVDFMSFPTRPFYIHVTAVYNVKHIESVYSDSAKCDGALTGITKNNESRKFSIYPQPFFISTILQSNIILKEADLRIYNATGILVKEMKNINGETISIQRDNLAAGFYFIQLWQNNDLIGKEQLIIADH